MFDFLDGLAYWTAAVDTTVVFAGYILYCLIRKRAYKIWKFFALHGVSLTIISIGYLCSEWYINNDPFSGGAARWAVSELAMLIALVCIVILVVLLRKKPYVFNPFVTKALVVLDALLVCAIILKFVLPDFEGFIAMVLFSQMFLYLPLLDLFGR